MDTLVTVLIMSDVANRKDGSVYGLSQQGSGWPGSSKDGTETLSGLEGTSIYFIFIL